jgi:hypothetical protein
MRKHPAFFPALVLLIFSFPAAAQTGAVSTGLVDAEESEITEALLPVYGPPGGIVVQDHPNDAGNQLDFSFEPALPVDQVFVHQILRRETGADDDSWQIVNLIAAGEPTTFTDGLDPDYPIEPGGTFEYMVTAVFMDETEISSDVYQMGFMTSGEAFHTGKVRVLFACALFLALIFYYFQKAQSGIDMYLRPIGGIEAIDEAIGRATEMGKPILYVPGLSTISDVATIASLTILGRVAKKVAEYQTPLLVPNRDPIVYTVADETVKQGYLEAGRPDAYDPDSVFFLTDSQFAFVAGVNGIMMREKPATNFYLGMFWAESLILAETGSLSGAIQIAGTDAVVQLPFFITTCDYTLIGEELYAASAYLGREPKQLGAVKGQDAMKGVVMTFITVGFVAGILDIFAGTHILGWIQNLVSMPIVD